MIFHSPCVCELAFLTFINSYVHLSYAARRMYFIFSCIAQNQVFCSNFREAVSSTSTGYHFCVCGIFVTWLVVKMFIQRDVTNEYHSSRPFNATASNWSRFLQGINALVIAELLSQFIICCVNGEMILRNTIKSQLQQQKIILLWKPLTSRK